MTSVVRSTWYGVVAFDTDAYEWTTLIRVAVVERASVSVTGPSQPVGQLEDICPWCCETFCFWYCL